MSSSFALCCNASQDYRNRDQVSSSTTTTVTVSTPTAEEALFRDLELEMEEDSLSIVCPKHDYQSLKALKKKNLPKNGNHKYYVHVPHRDKPPQVVAKRNARERRRVQAVNNAFVVLRKAVPFEHNRGKRLSKVKTLQYAIDYIHCLQDILKEDDFYYCRRNAVQEELFHNNDHVNYNATRFHFVNNEDFEIATDYY